MTQFDFTTPVGRFISGDAFEPQTKNQQGAPLVDKQGQPTKKWFMGVAFDKNNPEFSAWYQQYQARAMADWAHLFDPATGQCRAANFSWKIVDGDGFDQAGKPWSSREGYAGHWVVRFQSNFAPSVYHKDRYDPMMKVTDPAQLPRGYYVRIMGNAKGNGNNEKPGMFCNLSVIEIFAPGQVIVGGPDVATGFGQTAATFIPQGVLASPAMAPTMPGGAVAPQMGLAAPQAAPAMGMPPAPAQVPMMPGAPAPAMGATMPAMGMPPAPAQAPAMTMPAGGILGQPAQAPQIVDPQGGQLVNYAENMTGAPGLTPQQINEIAMYRQQGHSDDAIRSFGYNF